MMSAKKQSVVIIGGSLRPCGNVAFSILKGLISPFKYNEFAFAGKKILCPISFSKGGEVHVDVWTRYHR